MKHATQSRHRPKRDPSPPWRLLDGVRRLVGGIFGIRAFQPDPGLTAKRGIADGAPPFDLSSLARLPGGVRDLIVCTLFINVLSLAMPLSLVQIYDRIIPNSAEATLVLLGLGIATALLLEAVLRQVRSYVSGRMGARFEHLANSMALERVMEASLVETERQGPGARLERLNGLSILKEFYAGQAILVLCDFPFTIIFLAVIAYLAGALVLVPIALVAMFSAFAFFLGRRLRKSLDERRVADERRFNFIIEALGGIHTIKAMAMENQILRRYEKLQENCAATSYRLNFDSSSAQSVSAASSQMSVFALAGFGSLMVIDGSLTVGALVACTMLTGRCLQPLQKALGIWTRFQAIQLARRQVLEVMELPPETRPGLPALPAARGDLELRRVTFGYGKNKDGEDMPPVLEDVSLRVAAGETVGITGASACGKSTLLGLMAGVLRPTEGAVIVDTHDLAAVSPGSVRGQVVYVPQHGVLFNGTILENITMFQEAREDTAFDVARRLGLDEVVRRMPAGFETKVGVGASDTLGRGIKQRIMIARALVNKPRVLLFDEANAAIDSHGDGILHALLEEMRGACTMILVTHRPSTLKLADRVFEIANGRLVERPDLVTRNAPYLKLERPA